MAAAMDDLEESVASSPDAEKKHMDDPDAPIILKVYSLSGEEKESFRIKRNMKLLKLMKVYSDSQCVGFDYFNFLFDGRRLHEENTPYKLQMKDGDRIIAYPPYGGKPNICPLFELTNGEYGFDLCDEANN